MVIPKRAGLKESGRERLEEWARGCGEWVFA
jgi:hypothetical protein